MRKMLVNWMQILRRWSFNWMGCETIVNEFGARDINAYESLKRIYYV